MYRPRSLANISTVDVARDVWRLTHDALPASDCNKNSRLGHWGPNRLVVSYVLSLTASGLGLTGGAEPARSAGSGSRSGARSCRIAQGSVPGSTRPILERSQRRGS